MRRLAAWYPCALAVLLTAPRLGAEPPARLTADTSSSHFRMAFVSTAAADSLFAAEAPGKWPDAADPVAAGGDGLPNPSVLRRLAGTAPTVLGVEAASRIDWPAARPMASPAAAVGPAAGSVVTPSAWSLPTALPVAAALAGPGRLPSPASGPRASRVGTVVANLGGGTGIGHVGSSNTGTSPLNGFSVNAFLGADTFYADGYTGTRARLANVEGGHVWNGHETLTHVAAFVNGPGTLGVPGNYDRHATWVASVMAGRPTANPLVAGGEYQRGIAHGATLLSGAIATSWQAPPFNLGFNFNSYQAFIRPYGEMLLFGPNNSGAANTADVVNSSWGFGNDSSNPSIFTRGVDALARASGKVVVFSAGNSGPAPATIGGPATAFNVITVAALGSDTSDPPYNTVSSFSSRGPISAFVPANVGSSSGQAIAGARQKIDIAAPGQDLTGAFYGGATGGNGGGTVIPGSGLYSPNLAGTSFAAPTVAGGASLLVDVGKALNLTNSADGRVVKAVLLNSADKTANWDNGQALQGPTVRTIQGLDNATGAGRMNLTRAYPYYANPSATRDVPGTSGGLVSAAIAAVGWDFGQVTQGAANEYRFSSALAAANFTVTLDWFVNRTIDTSNLDFNTLQDRNFADLNLQVWRILGGVPEVLVGESASLYNNVEHLSFNLPAAGDYLIRVTYNSDVWDFVSNTTELYGLAWSATPVPEPAACLLAVAVTAGLGRLRRGNHLP